VVKDLGHGGGGVMVSISAFYSEDLSSMSATKILNVFTARKDEGKLKRGWGWPIFKKSHYLSIVFQLMHFLGYYLRLGL